ncbi:hypothetical protein BT96DRAFT_947939 [Gymnopus androsaceus JB14]|uniref:CxC2-like cysteine cluster KDZ transposase-associated domain-containing protein n=1 Tax=Gymnopus androsaceus JB14 TaxID=1447944 RepID=A0A6A4GRK5_9AGAR|nr:hypothetical protein BT96DRAFT_947939 [Gymnopus androsaceus JB14]
MLGVQPFAKALCDLEGSAFCPYLSTELYAAFDVYVAILNSIRKQNKSLLGREGQSWRLLNSCPSCQYRLKEDEQLDVRMITQMDGNVSLRRVERKEDVLQEKEESGQDLPAASKEPIDRSQYPLALLYIFFTAEKEEQERNGEGIPKGKLANAYNISCKFSKSVQRSPLNVLAQWAKFLPVVGTMHGMREAGITSSQAFYDWLVEEGEYLRNLTRTPPQEALKTEYYLKLEALQTTQGHVAMI